MSNDNQFKITYSIGTVFEGGGTGNIAGQAVRAIDDNNKLKKLLCVRSDSTWIEKSKVKEFSSLFYLNYPVNTLDILIKAGIHPYWVDKAFDKLASKHIGECDIFHGWNNSCLKSLEIAKSKGATTVVERASSHPKTQEKILNKEAEKYGIKRKPERHLERSCKELEKCDYITVPSDFVKESFTEQGFDEEKLIKIPFGVDINKFSPETNHDSTFRAIFVGSVQLRKGIQYMLKAWDSLEIEDAELLVCGKIQEDAKPVVEKYKDNDSINFLGHVNEVPYDKADIFVFPSLEEGSALVTYEAMASGLPIIVTPNTGSVARDGEEGFILPIRAPDKIAEKIKYFYENPNEIQKMGDKARKRAETYTWERYQKKLMENYKKIEQS